MHKLIYFYSMLLALIFVACSAHPVYAAKYVQSQTPTIFVHGWGSGAHAEEKMANAANQAGVTKTIIRANVSRQGQVTFNQPVPKHAINPIIEVNLADNKLSGYQDDYPKGYHHGATYVKNVITALQKRGYRSFNLVGHSMGNLEIINYINDNANHLPKIKHLVAIAGHYNGLRGQHHAEQGLENTGQPQSMDPGYCELLSLRKTFPTDTPVLNIYGDLDDGSHSDGDVPVNSAKSLRYLVASRAKSYQEVAIYGKKAQHSQLHNGNRQVDQTLIKFLWEK